MQQYFEAVCDSLTFEDINLLSILYDNDANAAFKSMKLKDVLHRTGYTESVFRRVMYRLNGGMLIDAVQSNKALGLYLTQFGSQALTKSMKLTRREARA
jgi:hypothetical protein